MPQLLNALFWWNWSLSSHCYPPYQGPLVSRASSKEGLFDSICPLSWNQSSIGHPGPGVGSPKSQDSVSLFLLLSPWVHTWPCPYPPNRSCSLDVLHATGNAPSYTWCLGVTKIKCSCRVTSASPLAPSVMIQGGAAPKE